MSKDKRSCYLIIFTAFLSPALNAADELDAENLKNLIQEESDGYFFGDFKFKPEASLIGIYDSNIFATRNNEVDDEISVFTPSLSAASQWNEHELNFALSADFGRYTTYDSEDYNDYRVSTDGRYDITDQTNIFGGISHSQEHEERGSLDDDLSGDSPTVFVSNQAHFGIKSDFGEKTSVRLGTTYESLDFDNAGLLDNKDRNRDMTGVGIRVNYALTPQTKVYGQAILDDRDYDKNTDDLGYKRDSDGYRTNVGISTAFSNRLKGEVYIGHLEQEYEDSRFSKVSELDFGGSLSWRASPRTSLLLSLDRSLEETTTAGASSYLYTSLAASLRHKLTPKLDLNAVVSASKAVYEDILRDERYYSGTLGLQYYLTPSVYLGAEYRLLKHTTNSRIQDSNPASLQDQYDFDRSQLFFTIGTALYPVKPTQYWEMPSGQILSPSGYDWRGLYSGLQLGHDTVNLKTLGGRDTGTDQGNYSDSALSSGFFAGYGKSWNRWYAGLEVDYEDSATNIYHRKSKLTSRTINVDKDSSYGLALRGGYHLANGALFYSRVGLVQSEFDAYTTVNSKTEFADDDSHDVSGIRWGIGSDIPINDHLFLRLGYSFTDYDSFDTSIIDADDVRQSERFSPTEDLFHIGLGWQFANLGGSQKTVEFDYDGLYAGADISHGALQSNTSGLHNDGSAPLSDPGPYDFFSDFGNDSFGGGGVFMGYGYTHNDLYLGVEGRIENSNADWSHERAPSGRDFSVEKMGSVGMSLRGGYILDNGSLLYAHAGRVRTKFNTTWMKGSNQLNDVDRDDDVSGTRIGIGAELPITKSVAVRLDYSRTDYDSYSFTTSHSEADTMSFKNNDNRFSLGLSVHF